VTEVVLFIRRDEVVAAVRILEPKVQNFNRRKILYTNLDNTFNS
jgi:hypothetical protein